MPLVRGWFAPFFRMKRVDQNNAGDFRWVCACKRAVDHGAERMADEHERWLDARMPQESSQLVDHRWHCSGRARYLAPREPGAVVAAHPRELRDFRLHATPGQRGRGDACVQDDCRSAGAVAPAMEAVIADRNESTGRRKCPSIAGGAKYLIQKAGGRQHRDDPKKAG